MNKHDRGGIAAAAIVYPNFLFWHARGYGVFLAANVPQWLELAAGCRLLRIAPKAGPAMAQLPRRIVFIVSKVTFEALQQDALFPATCNHHASLSNLRASLPGTTMLFGQDRDKLRRFYCETWAARRQGMPLEPLQAQIAEVIEQHPEYQPLIEDTERALAKDYLPELGESNPFLHMGMHLAIREQVGTDRPPGIRALYRRLLLEYGDAHALEHHCMDCLAEMLWSAQKQATQPDENAYLECLKGLSRAP